MFDFYHALNINSLLFLFLCSEDIGKFLATVMPWSKRVKKKLHTKNCGNKTACWPRCQKILMFRSNLASSAAFVERSNCSPDRDSKCGSISISFEISLASFPNRSLTSSLVNITSLHARHCGDPHGTFYRIHIMMVGSLNGILVFCSKQRFMFSAAEMITSSKHLSLSLYYLLVQFRHHPLSEIFQWCLILRFDQISIFIVVAWYCTKI